MKICQSCVSVITSLHLAAGLVHMANFKDLAKQAHLQRERSELLENEFCLTGAKCWGFFFLFLTAIKLNPIRSEEMHFHIQWWTNVYRISNSYKLSCQVKATQGKMAINSARSEFMLPWDLFFHQVNPLYFLCSVLLFWNLYSFWNTAHPCGQKLCLYFICR